MKRYNNEWLYLRKPKKESQDPNALVVFLAAAADTILLHDLQDPSCTVIA